MVHHKLASHPAMFAMGRATVQMDLMRRAAAHENVPLGNSNVVQPRLASLPITPVMGMLTVRMVRMSRAVKVG